MHTYIQTYKHTNKQTTRNNTKQTTPNKQQTANNKQRSTNSEQQTANNEQQTTNSKQRTANNEQQTTNSKQQTANSKQRTANSEQRATSNEQRATHNKQQTEFHVIPRLMWSSRCACKVPSRPQETQLKRRRWRRLTAKPHAAIVFFFWDFGDDGQATVFFLALASDTGAGVALTPRASGHQSGFQLANSSQSFVDINTPLKIPCWSGLRGGGEGHDGAGAGP